ncbi:hypothetical protein ACMU_16055 [Actibacterium mucosum KCTC 23349]|uniref:DUF4387 domain-containing protein n=1 Tax=Actibacterium mucosum KCTC 23349 TaxID=1454373 RepID=A0A037ZGG8_9RHOB|nr:DUF4387 family protein [Actibacterium mucosum]KAJ54631.1 hypothetical protein ACMU_16055 [Actibacterium mucosum KCTC 23349]
MTHLTELVTKIRSKNAGPFWLTVDIFCGNPPAFLRVSTGLKTSQVAAAFATDESKIKRFDISELNVVKFSLPRPAVQGTTEDRDMHGAAYAQVLSSVEI